MRISRLIRFLVPLVAAAFCILSTPAMAQTEGQHVDITLRSEYDVVRPGDGVGVWLTFNNKGGASTTIAGIMFIIEDSNGNKLRGLEADSRVGDAWSFILDRGEQSEPQLYRLSSADLIEASTGYDMTRPGTYYIYARVSVAEAGTIYQRQSNVVSVAVLSK
jgi:hypothetical protein